MSRLVQPYKFFFTARIKASFRRLQIERQKESWKLNPTQERYQAAKYSEDRAGGAGAYQACKNVLRSNKAFWQELYCCGEEEKKKRRLDNLKKFNSKSCEEIMTTVYKPIEFVVDGLACTRSVYLSRRTEGGKVMAGTWYVLVGSERRKSFRSGNYTRNCALSVFRGQLCTNPKSSLWNYRRADQSDCIL